MIKGVHAMFYSPEAEALREFFRDKLGLPFFDSGEGWLIFTPSAAEVGCHPSEEVKHEISFYCDDLEATIAELRSRGVEFTQEVENHGYALVTSIKAPGDVTFQLYQPLYG